MSSEQPGGMLRDYRAARRAPTLQQPYSTDMLYHAHSGLRYLILLTGAVALLVFAYSLIGRRPVRAASALGAIFTGLLDLQILLGLGLFFGGIVYDALMGHMVMMILAAIAANGSAILAPRATTERQEMVMRIAGVAIALACIVIGILAIGRPILGSAPATIVR